VAELLHAGAWCGRGVIVDSAHRFYCFCKPELPELPPKMETDINARTDPLGCFLRHGGFLYLDAMYKVVSICALSYSAADNAEVRSSFPRGVVRCGEGGAAMVVCRYLRGIPSRGRLALSCTLGLSWIFL
jgi:hypothetical protein